MIYKIEAACGSNIGCVRSNNEDNFYFGGTVLPQENYGQRTPLHYHGGGEADECMAVFDGMGGGDFGEAASFAAAIQLKAILEQPREKENIERYLESISQQLNVAVYDAQNQLASRQMGSTLAMLYFYEDSVYACNVGDSRIFGLRGDRLMQISRDHTDEAYMKAQDISGRQPRLTQFLGMDPGKVCIEPYIVKGQVHSGDTYLICSDGLTDMLTPEQIKEVLLSARTARTCVEELINRALDQGGRDNVTVIVCRILEQVRPCTENCEQNTTDSSWIGVRKQIVSEGQKLWREMRDAVKASRRK